MPERSGGQRARVGRKVRGAELEPASVVKAGGSTSLRSFLDNDHNWARGEMPDRTMVMGKLEEVEEARG